MSTLDNEPGDIPSSATSSDEPNSPPKLERRGRRVLNWDADGEWTTYEVTYGLGSTRRSEGTHLFALLVGINTWDPMSRVRSLRGCLNDTKAVETFLLENLKVPGEHVKILRDSEATRDGIINAFRSHLIKSPDIQPGDQILFHYSGHGSRVRDFQGIEPDGYHESLVAYDSRTPGKCDLLDKELGELLDELAQSKGSNITVILDSCHSGSGTRDVPADENTPLSREIEADQRPLPPEVAKKIARLAGVTRSVTPSVAGWVPGDMPYVLISGCREEQLSREYEGSPAVWNGALTYFTLEYLKRMSPTATYRDLHETVAVQVNGLYKSQEPQCEGQRDRVIFGGVTVERYPFITVKNVEGNTVHLNGGIVHDLREGTELALYLPDVRTRADLKGKSPLVKVRVVSADVTTAEAEIIEEAGEVRTQREVPQFARAVITAQAYNPNLQKVALVSDGTPESDSAIAQLRTALEGDGIDIKPSLLLHIVSAEEAAFVVKAIAGQYQVYDGGGKLLLQPEDFNRADDETSEVGALRVRQGLEGIARHRAVLNLKNDESAELDSQIKVSLHQVIPGTQGRKASDTPEPTQSDGSILVSYDPDENKTYAVEVRNDTGETLFANVFLSTSNYGIYRLYPNNGQNDSIKGPFTIGLRQSGERPIGIRLEADEISSTDYLKVILTPEPADLAGLSQEALGTPSSMIVRGYGSFLDRVIDTVDGGTRGLKVVDFEGDGRPWAALTVPIKTVRKGDVIALLPNQDRVTLPGELGGMTLEKPAAFSGKLTVTTLEQETRALGDVRMLRLPASVTQAGYEMVQRVGSRSTDPARLMIWLEVEDEAIRRSITPDNPLQLHLGDLQDRNADILPVYFDGEDFLPAGYTLDGVTVVLTHVPLMMSAIASDEVQSRGFANAITLYIFQKKRGRKDVPLGLHAVEVDDWGRITPKPFPKIFKAGDQVCLFVHGFTSDSESIVAASYQMLKVAGKQHYEHYLSFDHESFGTSVPNNALNLSHALRDECGFHKDDGITVHIIAHSTGGFTTRYFIQGEATKGYEIVDRVILAGVPNHGTPLASVANGGLWTATFLLNQLGGIPFGKNSLQGLLSEWHEDMAGLSDLRVGSPAIQQLKDFGALPIPFLVLTGTINLTEQRRWQTLAQKVLKVNLHEIFGEDNDGLIGLSSLRQIGIRDDPNLTLPDPLPCNHCNYFILPEVIELTRDFIEFGGGGPIKSHRDTIYYLSLEITGTEQDRMVGSRIQVIVRLLKDKPSRDCLEVEMNDSDFDGGEVKIHLYPDNFIVESSGYATFPVGASYPSQETSFFVRPLRPGMLLVRLTAQWGEQHERFTTQSITVGGIGDDETIKFLPLRPRPIPYPNFLLQIRTEWSHTEGEFRYVTRLDSLTGQLEEGYHARSRWVTEAWNKRIWQIFRDFLATATAPISIKEGTRLRVIGELLASTLFPQDEDPSGENTPFSVLQQYAGQRLTLMVLVSADPKIALPWELLYLGTTYGFITEAYTMGRWAREVESIWTHEFPIGQLSLTGFGDPQESNVHPRLFRVPEASPPIDEPRWCRDLAHDSEAANQVQMLHIVKSITDSHTTFLPKVISKTQDADVQSHDIPLITDIFTLRRTRPLVALSYHAGTTTELTELESHWFPAYLRVGCSALVAPHWAVPPTSDVQFFSTFYYALWHGDSLGTAFEKGRQHLKTYAPHTLDYLAYVLYGDPMAHAYRLTEGEGYVVIEPIGREIETPVQLGSPAHFRIKLQSIPPEWHEGRLIQVKEELKSKDVMVRLTADTRVTIVPDAKLVLARTAQGHYYADFNITVPPTFRGDQVEIQAFVTADHGVIGTLFFDIPLTKLED